MPIPNNIAIERLPAMIERKVSEYDSGKKGAIYNCSYRHLIEARSIGIHSYGSLGKWISSSEAGETIYCLLDSFGMNAQKSRLVDIATLTMTLTEWSEDEIAWVNSHCLPLKTSPANTDNRILNTNLAGAISRLYNYFSIPGNITRSGGFVASSKTMHCLFPQLCPMIDGRHTGLSYYYIPRTDYTPPPGCISWSEWIGHDISGPPNPSPRGAGRKNWKSDQYLAAIEINQKIYELWKGHSQDRDLTKFVSIDNGKGASGIPRIIDKLLW